jgi:hypothetical protein
MPVSSLTGLVEELQSTVFEMRNTLNGVTGDIQTRFDELGTRLDTVSRDARGTFDELTGHLDRLAEEMRGRLDQTDVSFNEMRQRVSDITTKIEQEVVGIQLLRGQLTAWFALPWWQRLFHVINV